ncbi:MAG: hypothetical protein HJJLKODD_01850 [Phycisphaerae bacterium]|nr:hypothetical protein [Phycisphaerae bacterium]
MTAISAALLAVILDWGAYHFSPLVLELEWAWTFLIAWILYSIMHRTSGDQCGILFTTVVVILTIIVIISTNVIYANHGVISEGGEIIHGSFWLNPSTLLFGHILSWASLSIATLLLNDGASIGSSICSLLMSGGLGDDFRVNQ